MKIGFIGLGNVDARPAGSLLRNGYGLTIRYPRFFPVLRLTWIYLNNL